MSVEIPLLDRALVLATVSIEAAIDGVREAFVRHHRGEWQMPPKVYLPSPPHGDFRAMPARGDDLALLKWVTSFPGNPQLGLPTVTGIIIISDAVSGAPLALIDAQAVTALRTGAVAAVATQALARDGATTVGLIGCGQNGAWAGRSLAAAGYGPGICVDPQPQAAEALAAELGWRAGDRAEALAADVVCCVTPGSEVVVTAADLRPGMHLNMLGADSAEKAEASIDAVVACTLFCDEWAQAAHGGELSGAVAAGLIDREQVTELGAVLTGEAPGRPGPEAVTMFDSTGTAIQDLAIGALLMSAWRAGRMAGAQTVRL